MIICRALLTFLILLAVVSSSRSAISQLRPDLVRELSTGGDWIEFHTPYGPIPIRLLPGNAPKTVELIKRAVEDEANPLRCKENCLFYRAEARPKTDNGPPYGLLQGKMDLDEIPPKEGQLQHLKGGHLAIIPNSTDFFIALSDHKEWGHGHTVAGIIGDWLAVELIGAQDYDEIKHETFGTIMRMMKNPVRFTIGKAINVREDVAVEL